MEPDPTEDPANDTFHIKWSQELADIESDHSRAERNDLAAFAEKKRRIEAEYKKYRELYEGKPGDYFRNSASAIFERAVELEEDRRNDKLRELEIAYQAVKKTRLDTLKKARIMHFEKLKQHFHAALKTKVRI